MLSGAGNPRWLVPIKPFWRIVMATITAFPVSHSELLTKITDRTARVGIIGLGYVGLPLTLLFNEQRFAITGFDIDLQKVRILSEGGSYIYRIPATDIAVANSRG